MASLLTLADADSKMSESSSIFASLFSHRRGGAAIVESDYTVPQHIQCWVTFFMVSLASRAIAPHFKRLGFPALTGNVVVGAICGPYILDIVVEDDVASLNYINMFALAYITTSAGAELIIAELRKTIVTLTIMVFAMAGFIFAAVTVATQAMAKTSLVSFTEGMSGAEIWAVAMIMGGMAVTGSPAAAVAVVRELQCKGTMTATFLGILMMIDVVVLVMMPLILANADALFAGVEFQAKTAGVVIGTLIASCVLGLVVAAAYMLTMRVKHGLVHNFVFPIGFAVFLACAYLTDWLSYKITEDGVHVSFEPLLMCMVGGFVTVNFSQYHHRFHHALEHAGPNIFLPFFTLVGASLDLVTFIKALPFAIILSIIRALMIFAGTAIPGYLLKQSAQMNKTLWMTQISQAGFSLGLAAQVGKQFPGWGVQFQAVIISCVVVNQLVGPFLCKFALKWSGESGLGMTAEEKAFVEAENDPFALHTADMNKAVIIGVTPKSKAIAFALLKKRWGVAVLTSTVDEATLLDEQVSEWAEKFRAEYLFKYRAESSRTLDVTAPIMHHESNFKAVPFIMPEIANASDEAAARPRLDSTMSTTLATLSHEMASGEKFGGAFGADDAYSELEGEGAAVEVSSSVLKPTFESAGQKTDPESTAANGPTESRSAGSSLSFRPGDSANVTVEIMPRGTSFDKSGKQIIPRGTSLDMLLPPSALSGNMTPVGIHDVLDNTDHLQTVVLAFETDQAAIGVLKMLLERWDEGKASKVRVVVLIQEAESAAAVAALGAVAVHDFVASHSQAILASVTPYDKDAILVPAAPTQAAWSANYLELFEQKQFSMA